VSALALVPARVIRKGAEAEGAWLEAHGYDGLACVAEPCGCHIGDLHPCGERGDRAVCVPGYRNEDGVGIVTRRGVCSV
jgi:hypothetical protein